MKARIITIGDEILIGQVVDTNSAWMATQLNLLGVTVESIVSVADTEEAIHQALDNVNTGISMVFMTGGLGPTKDDITKEALARWFQSDWKVDELVLERVHRHFSERGVPMPEVNKGQARVPSVCEVLFNDHGSAPGMWFEKNEIIFVSMPGVPYEMKHIFSDRVVPRIVQRLSQETIYHRTIMTQGIGESSLMEIISDWEEGLKKEGLKLAYLPSPGVVRLRVTGKSTDGEKIMRDVERQVREVIPLIADFAYGFDDEKLEAVVGTLMRRQNFTVSAAESCTGGYISHLFTSIPGSSVYFKGAVVSYANEAKVNTLGVDPTDLRREGAVSEEVAMQMASGAKQVFKTDFAISATGVAGPDGGTPEKPVGTVWIGVATPTKTFALKYMMGTHRERNIRKTALQALQLLRKEILHEIKISEVEALFFKEN